MSFKSLRITIQIEKINANTYCFNFLKINIGCQYMESHKWYKIKTINHKNNLLNLFQTINSRVSENAHKTKQKKTNVPDLKMSERC